LAAGSSPVEQATQAIVDRDFPRATAILKATATDKSFEALPEADRHEIYLLLAQASFYARDRQTAADAIREACASSASDGADWSLRVMISAEVDDVDLANSLVVISEKYPANLSRLWDPFLLQQLYHLAQLPDRNIGLRALKALFAAHWKPTRIDPDAVDELWLLLILADLKDNDLPAAKAVAAAIGSPNTLIKMISDKRFDAVVAADPAHYDIGAAAAAALERAKARRGANPQLLEPVDALAQALMRLDRNDEALAAIDAALAAAHKDENAFVDTDYALPWVTERRGALLVKLGRKDDDVAERQQAAALPERGTDNVSQTLNLAQKLNNLGRPREALATLKKVPSTQMSGYGRMAYEAQRACAYAQLKDKENFSGAMLYLKKNAVEAPQVTMQAYTCAKDEDGLAAEMIVMLDNPDTRLNMLFELQDFRGPKGSALDDAEDDWALKVQRRADVQAAIARTGRVQNFPIRLVN
jgi:tetratricopeptide (TPR) repeat protein